MSGFEAGRESFGSEVLDLTESDLAYRVSCSEMADGWVTADRYLLPDGFEDLPLPFLSVLAGSVDRSRLNGYDLIRLMRAESRLSSAFEAGKLASIAEVAFSPPGDVDSVVERSPNEVGYAAAEIGAALTLTRRAAESQLDLALCLTGRLDRVWERYAEGRLSLAMVREFVRVLGHLDAETIGDVLDRCLDAAPGLTSGQLRARLHRLVLEADPEGVAHGLTEGVLDRKVVSYQNPDLTGSIGILSAHPSDVAAAMAYVDGLARSLRVEGEERTLDQIRSDVALDLLRGRRFGEEPRARVVVTVSAATIEGIGDEPGSLEGFGPVTAEIARKIVFENVDGEWVFIVSDNGAPVATGTLARRPTAGQERHVRANYPTCVFPGCRMSSHQCDLDHRRPHAEGGPTHNDNLGPLCRHHHMMRHHAPWQLERLPNGDHRWTSPHGHTHLRPRSPPE